MRKIQRDVEKQKKAAEMALNEDSMTELRVRVRDTSSGKILKGENAPLASELEAWLEKVCLGAIFILRKDIGVGGWSRKWQFSLTLCSENVLT